MPEHQTGKMAAVIPGLTRFEQARSPSAVGIGSLTLPRASQRQVIAAGTLGSARSRTNVQGQGARAESRVRLGLQRKRLPKFAVITPVGLDRQSAGCFPQMASRVCSVWRRSVGLEPVEAVG
jgi:hypothetical protein